jgi:hypothetical protein
VCSTESSACAVQLLAATAAVRLTTESSLPPSFFDFYNNIKSSEDTKNFTIFQNSHLPLRNNAMPHTNVFTDFEERVMSAGRNSESIVQKLKTITFEEFEYLSMFQFFEEFIVSLPGKPTSSSMERFRRVMNFAKAKVVVYQLRAEVSTAL